MGMITKCKVCEQPLRKLRVNWKCDNCHLIFLKELFITEFKMEKHGYTPKQQAIILRATLDKISQEIYIISNHVDRVLNNLDVPLDGKVIPDYGGIAVPGMSDIAALVNRANNTATCLQTLIMLAAIENKQI